MHFQRSGLSRESRMNVNMTTLVCFALKEEAAPFRKIAAGGLRRGHQVSILLTGIGRQNAEKSVREFLASHSPEWVLTCGFAGGLNPDLKIGDVVFEIPSRSSRGNEAQTEIGNRQSAIGNKMEPPHVGCYEKLVAAGAKPAKFFCADRIATTVAEKKTVARADRRGRGGNGIGGDSRRLRGARNSLRHRPRDFRHGRRGFAAGFQPAFQAGQKPGFWETFFGHRQVSWKNRPADGIAAQNQIRGGTACGGSERNTPVGMRCCASGGAATPPYR